MSKISNLAPEFFKSFASGTTLGFASKAEAAIAAKALQAMYPNKSYGELYDIALKASKNVDEQRGKDYPVTNFVGEFGGGAALPFKSIGLGKYLMPTFKTAPTTVKGAAALGAGYGALSGIGHNTEGGFTEDMLAGLMGAGPGAVIGGGMQYLQNTPILNKLFNYMGNLASKAGEHIPPQLKQMGKSAKGKAKVPTIEEINSLMTSAVPEGEALAAQFGVPLTKGEHTLLPEHFYNEEQALRGWEGVPKMEEGKSFQDTQRQAFYQAVEKVQKDLVGIKPDEAGFISKGQHASKAAKFIQDQAENEKKLVGQAYKEAGKEEAVFDINNIRKFPLAAENMLQDTLGVTAETAPNAYKQLTAFQKLFNRKFPEDMGEVTTASLKGLEAWRKGINQARSDFNIGNQDKAALNALGKTYDDYVDDLVEKSLIKGDKIALDKLKEARGIASQWFKKYGSGKPGEVGQNFINDLVTNAENGINLTNEELVNKILGMSKIGFGPQAGSVVGKLKEMLPKETFNEIKLEALERILTPLKKGMSKTGEEATKASPNPGIYLNNLLDFKKQYPTLVNHFFAPKEFDTLVQIGKLGHRIYTRPINRLNPSGSGEMYAHLRKLVTSLPLGVGKTIEMAAPFVNILDRQKTSFRPLEIKGQLTNPERPLSAAKKALLIEEINRDNK